MPSSKETHYSKNAENLRENLETIQRKTTYYKGTPIKSTVKSAHLEKQYSEQCIIVSENVLETEQLEIGGL